VKITKLAEDVYQITDFLTEEELAQVNLVINGLTEDMWFPGEKKEKDDSDFWYGKNINLASEDAFFAINEKLKDFLDSYFYYPTEIMLSRYTEGDYMKEHRDEWKFEPESYIGYGFCLYYNDDYEGGELEYPELGIKIKPPANSVCIHGGDVLHRSLPVIGNKVRYFSTKFITGTCQYPTKLKKEIFK
jgi:Rps23 Pro-64 3,4-dihydroxylase Tpa1-like proline 4-hydroxylase